MSTIAAQKVTCLPWIATKAGRLVSATVSPAKITGHEASSSYTMKVAACAPVTLRKIYMKARNTLLAALTAVCGSALAQTPAMDWATNSTNGTSVTSTRGYSFDVTEAGGIMVTHLSFFDDGADGLTDRHDVGLWDSGGTLLAQTTISAGTADPLDATGKFRTNGIAPIFLAAGTDYVVAAVFVVGSPDLQAIGMTGLAMGSGLAYGETRFNNNGVGTLSFPTDTIAAIGLPGGSFQYTAVPEPATFVALGVGALALILRRRSK